MGAISESRLEVLLGHLVTCKQELGDAGYQLAAQLIEMTILEIKLKQNDISDAEFSALRDALERQWPPPQDSTSLDSEH